MAEYQTDRIVWRFVGQGAIGGLILGVLLAVGDRLGDLKQSILLVLSAPVVIAIIIQLVRIGVADVLPPVAVPAPETSTPEYFVRLRQLERRLELATRDQADFDWSLRPLLAQLAADRLRYRHGILYMAQPDRAREIVGEELWQIMRPSPDTQFRPIGRARMEDLISRIERI